MGSSLAFSHRFLGGYVQLVQDRYAGDIGDFSKFALIRVLTKHLQAQVGLIWYLFPDESHTNDGRHIGYVTDHRWQRCDPDLTNRLEHVARLGPRSVAALEQASVLRDGTRYFSEVLATSGVIAQNREHWFARAQQAVEGCGLVFVDPDNGIAGPNHRPGSAKGGKHITLREIRTLADAHPCVGIYHHFDRSAPHPDQIARISSTLQTLKPNGYVGCLRYRRISPRAYFFLAEPGLIGTLQAAFAELTSPPWDFHFSHH